MEKLNEPFHSYWNGQKNNIRPIKKQPTKQDATIDNEHYRKLKEAICQEAMERWT